MTVAGDETKLLRRSTGERETMKSGGFAQSPAMIPLDEGAIAPGDGTILSERESGQHSRHKDCGITKWGN